MMMIIIIIIIILCLGFIQHGMVVQQCSATLLVHSFIR